MLFGGMDTDEGTSLLSFNPMNNSRKLCGYKYSDFMQ